MSLINKVRYYLDSLASFSIAIDNLEIDEDIMTHSKAVIVAAMRGEKFNLVKHDDHILEFRRGYPLVPYADSEMGNVDPIRFILRTQDGTLIVKCCLGVTYMLLPLVCSIVPWSILIYLYGDKEKALYFLMPAVLFIGASLMLIKVIMVRRWVRNFLVKQSVWAD